MTDPRSERATSSSPMDSAAEQCADLLDGIELAAELRARVLEIVTADAVARRELVVHHPHRFWDQIAMIAARDVAVREQLQTDEQRTCFDATVARWDRIRRGGSEEP